MDETAFVSFRLPKAERDRLRALASERGQSLQASMQSLVREHLAKAELGRSPRLAEVLKTLRAHRDRLRDRGVSRVWVFGSVARGEERPDSDIDLIVEFDPNAKVSLTTFAGLRLDLCDLLGVPVDLAEWRSLRPQARAAAEREAVAAF